MFCILMVCFVSYFCLVHYCVSEWFHALVVHCSRKFIIICFKSIGFCCSLQASKCLCKLYIRLMGIHTDTNPWCKEADCLCWWTCNLFLSLGGTVAIFIRRLMCVRCNAMHSWWWWSLEGNLILYGDLMLYV